MVQRRERQAAPLGDVCVGAPTLSPSTGLPLWNTDEEMRPQAHQDSTYAGLLPADGALTAWVALSDAPVEAGCK